MLLGVFRSAESIVSNTQFVVGCRKIFFQGERFFEVFCRILMFALFVVHHPKRVINVTVTGCNAFDLEKLMFSFR